MKTLIAIVLFSVCLEAQSYRTVVLTPKAKKSTQLNGSSQYWTKATATGMDFGTATDFSIIAWAKHSTTAFGGLQRLAGKSASPSARFMFVGGASGNVMSALVSDGTNSALLHGITSVNDNKWHLFVMTADRDGFLRLYVDGIEEGTALSLATVGSVTTSSAFEVGGIGAASFWNGSVGEVQVVSGYVLTATEVSALAKTKTLKASYGGGSLVAWYQWNGGLDKSGSGNHLTPVSSPLIVNVRY